MQRQLNAAERIARTGSWRWRPPDRLMWSAGMYSIFGVPKGKPLLMEQFLELVHVDDRAPLTQYMERVRAGTAGRLETEYRVLLPGGDMRVIAAITDVRTSPRGKLIELVGTVQDVTERKRVEQALRKALEDRQAAVSAANVAFWDRDLVNDRMTYSKEYKQQLGYAEDEFGEGVEAWRGRVHPDDLEPAIERMRRFLESRDTFAQHEFRLRHRDGSYRWILTQASAVRDPDGRPLRLVGCHLDITERKEAEAMRRNLEAQLQQAQKLQALGTLAGGVAHDFNNLLLAIAGNVQLALADCPPEHIVHRSLVEIQHATARATALVRSMLTFSRANEGEQRTLQIQPVVTEALRLLRAAVPAIMTIRTTLPETLPNVRADAGQLHQVIMNLGANAAHAIGERAGLIDVCADEVVIDEQSASGCTDLRPGRYVRVTVSDDGVGMTQEIIDRIFEPFFTTKPPGAGTGLGLSVVHGIVSTHGGAIRVNSEPGRGTRVSVYLPASEAAPRVAALTIAPAPHGNWQHVFYLDDDEDIVLLMSRLLERQQYRVTGFTDPLLALAEFRQRPRDFDVFITDLSMPYMSGFEVAREVLEIRPDIPIVMTSGYVRPDDARRAQEIGVTSLLLKPNTVEDLARSLHEIFSARARGAQQLSAQ